MRPNVILTQVMDYRPWKDSFTFQTGTNAPSTYLNSVILQASTRL